MEPLLVPDSSKLANYVRGELVKYARSDRKNIGRISLSAQVPLPWLLLFTNGRIKNPGVDRIERLYEFFKGRELSI